MTDRTRLIIGTQFDSVTIDSFRDTWVVTAGAKILCDLNDAPALDEDFTGSNNTITVAGLIDHPLACIRADGTLTSVGISAGGQLTGKTGVRLQGENQSLGIDGAITVTDSALTGDAIAVVLDADGSNTMTNRGTIDSETLGVQIFKTATAVNSAGASILADDAVVDTRGAAAAVTVEVYNAGTMGGAAAWLGGASADHFFNSGTVTGNIVFGDGADILAVTGGSITGLVSMGAGADRINCSAFIGGDVDLGAGDDIIDLRRGALDGSLSAGLGNDTLITDTQDFRLAERANEGSDTVRSTVSYVLNQNVENLVLLGGGAKTGTGNSLDNVITGGRGADRIFGLAGSDRLWGGNGGPDRLNGGEGGDFFVFESGDGKDRIADFTSGEDRIDLSGWKAVTRFSSVLSHAADTAEGVAIRSGLDVLILTGIDKADLERGDFMF